MNIESILNSSVDEIEIRTFQSFLLYCQSVSFQCIDHELKVVLSEQTGTVHSDSRDQNETANSALFFPICLISDFDERKKF